MSEDLQPLLKQIQREGLDKARAEADALLEKARAEARDLIDKARAEAEALREAARRDAEAFDLRARESLKQAGRDLVLALEQRITRMMRRLLDQEVASVLQGEPLAELVTAAVRTRLQADEAEQVEVLLPAGQVDKLRAHLLGKLSRDVAADQVTVAADDRLNAGFSLRLDQGRVEHDFSADAIAAALAALLRPGLAKLLRDDQPE